VSPGTYQIGGWDEGEQVAVINLPAFWIARFPNGDDKGRNAFAQYEDELGEYREVLERKLVRLAEANPAFVQQLQTLAQNAGVQGSGIQGNVNGGQGSWHLCSLRALQLDGWTWHISVRAEHTAVARFGTKLRAAGKARGFDHGHILRHRPLAGIAALRAG
jgi:hypothetical protein